jgi:hypothetical protein
MLLHLDQSHSYRCSPFVASETVHRFSLFKSCFAEFQRCHSEGAHTAVDVRRQRVDCRSCVPNRPVGPRPGVVCVCVARVARSISVGRILSRRA